MCPKLTAVCRGNDEGVNTRRWGEGVKPIKEGNLNFHSSSLSSFLKHHTCWLDTYMYVTRMLTGSTSNVKWTQFMLTI